jgi:invasion protein IalB
MGSMARARASTRYTTSPESALKRSPRAWDRSCAPTPRTRQLCAADK